CFALMAAGSDDSCRAALEAMAAGRPVIARKVGALPETILHGETGLLVDDDHPETVAQALGEILADPGRGRAMGIAARARAESDFSADRSVQTVERVYQDLWRASSSQCPAADGRPTTTGRRGSRVSPGG